jgi:murein DD-endopeptidase MepM/ murein hydrolase activator NlpD
MNTKKLKGVVYAWNQNAFNGKGYWFVLGKNGAFGRAASKREAGYLNQPKKSEPNIEETPQKQISDKTEKSLGKLKDKFSSKNLKNIIKSPTENLEEKLSEEKDQTEMLGESKKSPVITPEKIGSIDTAFYASVAPTKIVPIKRGERVADVATKLLGLFNKTFAEKKLQRELNKNFELERHEEDKRRHDNLIKEIYKSKGMRAPKKKTNKTAEKLKGWDDLKNIVVKPGKGGGAKGGGGPSALAIGGGALALGAAGTAAFVASQEGGPALKAMNDEGHTAIGYGHDITEQEKKQGFISLGGEEKIMLSGEGGKDTTITKEQAQKLLEVDIPKYQVTAARAIGEDNWSKLNSNQKAALTSYTYNTGAGGILKLANDGLKDAIAKGDMQGAANIIKEKGIKTGQKSGFLSALARRRNDESALFLKAPSGESENAAASTQISSHFYRNSGAFHGALDIPGQQGQPVFATGEGTVIYGNSDPNGYGNHWIKIDHGNGLMTTYGHMSDRVVENGAKVKAGQQIGKMGNEGASTGTHLHYQIEQNGKKIDPESFSSPMLASWATSVKGIAGATMLASDKTSGDKIASTSSENKDLKQTTKPVVSINNAQKTTQVGSKPDPRILIAQSKQDYPVFMEIY